MNGGYVMFDASVLDLDNGGTLEGLYNKMQELFNSGKPLLLCGFHSADGYSKYAPVYTTFAFSQGDTDEDNYYVICFSEDAILYTLFVYHDNSYELTNTGNVQ